MKIHLPRLDTIRRRLKALLATDSIWPQVLLFRASLFIFVAMTVTSFPQQPGHHDKPYVAFAHSPFLDALVRWDSKIYHEIVVGGYNRYGLEAFFPLYPYSIRLFSKVVGDEWLSGLIISAVAFVSALHFFHLWMSRVDSRDKASQGVWMILFFPTTIYFNAYYTESTFFFFVCAAFYFYLVKKPWRAAFFGMLAAATRNPGVLLFPAFFLSTWIEGIQAKRSFKESLKDSSKFILIPLGLFAYCTLLWLQFRDPFRFITVQKEWGKQLGTWPLPSLWREFKGISLDHGPQMLSILAGPFAIFVGTWSLFKRDYAGGLFVILATLMPLSTGMTASLIRYITVFPPVYRYLAHKINLETAFGRAAWAMMILLCAYVTSLYALWYWVA